MPQGRQIRGALAPEGCYRNSIHVLGVSMKPTVSIRMFLLLLVVGCGSICSPAQQSKTEPVHDARWVTEYKGVQGKSSIWKDPRFRPMLREAFKEHPEVAKDFLAPWQTISEPTFIEERYAVFDGCPRHGCGGANWFLWIDTQSDTLDLIHVASERQGQGRFDPDAVSEFSFKIVGSEPLQGLSGPEILPKVFWKTLQLWFLGKEPFDEAIFTPNNRGRVKAASFEGPDRRQIPIPAVSLRAFDSAHLSSKR